MIYPATYLLGNAFYHFADTGFANFFALRTLSHGTNLFNYSSIRIFGGDPNHGNKWNGSTNNVMVDANCSSNFYVSRDFYHSDLCFKDKSLKMADIDSPFLFTLVKISLVSSLANFFSIRMHSFLSGFNCIAAPMMNLPLENPIVKTAGKIVGVFFGALVGIVTLVITPTIRFRVLPSEVAPLLGEKNTDGATCQFVEDPEYFGLAWMTPKKLEASRIGIPGSFITGLNKDWLSRIKANPIQFAAGVIQLAVAAAIVAVAVILLLKMTMPMAIGAGVSFGVSALLC